MNQIVELIRKKSHILFVLNSIEKYIKDKHFDENLKEVWDSYTKEVEEIDSKLQSMNIPALEEFENEKLELRRKIQHHEKELEKLNQQIKELNEISKTLA